MPEPAAAGYLVDVTKVSGPDGPRYKRAPYPSPTPSAYGPAGAIISTVGDLKVWARALARGELLDRPVQRQRIPRQSNPVIGVFTPLAGVDVPVTRGLPVRYGLGIADAGGFLGHNGAVDGYLAELWHEPSTGATIVVLLNASMIAEGTTVDVADDMFVSAAEIAVPRAVQTTNA
jgi:D-alanyl-D-alanine carboxypeptidase